MNAGSEVQVSVVMLGYGVEPYLRAALDSVLASVDDHGDPVDLELILVDNGAHAAVAALDPDERLTIIRPVENLGFAGGCNAGVRSAVGRDLVFVNSDAILERTAVHRLTSGLADDAIGIAGGSVRLADQPDVMNTAGNPVHFLGFVWAGSFGERHELHGQPIDIASASGAFFAVRRARWEQLGGFDEHYFAYHEDVDLSLRMWQHGYRVRYEPAAIAYHHYEFSRNPVKQYLLERNRWITVLTVFPRQVLLAVLPAMLAFEIPVCCTALAQGWLPDKLRSYRWLISHPRYLRERRLQVQTASRMSPQDFSALLASRIEPSVIERPPGLAALNFGLESYWALVRRLGRTRPAAAAATALAQPDQRQP